ncbi:amino acid adenylation domain-containing protein [Actinomadura monticuli]|uniref:Amino acid adenylation domain-containing protein n=1 Tax=Actinomadura monticuli TaxID=3097367 RepID=A0ABV4Q6D5_9ACTN
MWSEKTDDRVEVPSFAQERFWFLEDLAAGNAAHTTQQSYLIEGELAVDALTAALTRLVREHEPPRSRYALVKGELRMLISADGAADVRYLDVSADPDPEAQARALAIADAFAPFDLTRGPLLRTRLLRTGALRHVLILTAHRSAFDEYSFGIVERELAAGYAGAAPRRAPSYAAQARRQRAGGDDDLAYWRDALAGAPDALDLPTDRSRPPVPSYRAAEVTFEVPAPSAWPGTAGDVALAAFAALLSRHTRAAEMVVGVQTDGRAEPPLADMVGNLGGHLPVRIDTGGGATLGDLAERTARAVAEARAHRSVPFDRIALELTHSRDLSRHPIFQVSFGHAFAPSEPALPGLEVRRLDTKVRWSRVDLELRVVEHTSGALTCRFIYAEDLFEAETANRLVAHYRTLLDAFVARPDILPGEVALLTPAERRLVFESWNPQEPRLLTDLTISELFEAQVRRTPDAVAVVFGECRLTYDELNVRANRLARRLVAEGVGPEVIVGLCLRRGIPLVVAVLAVLKAGGAYLPLDPGNPPARNEYMLADATAAFVLTERALAATLPETPRIVLEEVAAEVALCPGGDLGRRSGADSMIYVIYTSGSTGLPKGVVMTHRPLTNLLGWQLARTSVAGPTLQFSSIGFDISFQEMFATWLAGGELVLLAEEDRGDPERMLEVMRRAGVRRLYCPPMVLEQLAQAADGDLPPLAEIVTAGEVLHLTPAVRRLLSRLDGVVLDNQYGPTEAHVITGHRMTGRPEDWPVHPPVGGAVSNTRVYLLDERGEAVPVGGVGEVHVGGVCLARGYLGRPDLTEELFRPDPYSPGGRMYRTGDLARRHNDGTLQFLGRVDEQIKIRGYRVEPGEIEAALATHSAVVDSTVLPVMHDGDRRLVAYLVLAPGTGVTAAELRAHLRLTLPEYMMPTSFGAVDAIPLTAVGKTDRARLPDPSSCGLDQDGVPGPSGDVEEVLTGIWREVIGAADIGPDDDFFQVGGHSLLVAKVIGRMRERLGVQIPFRALFEHSTVARLAAFTTARLAEGAPPAETSGPIAAAERRTAPLAPLQHGVWLLHQIHPDCVAYHMPVCFEVSGPLDPDVLDQALTLLAGRHATLRTGFGLGADGPEQRVTGPAGGGFQVVDLRHVPAAERDAVLRTRMDMAVGTPFDLTRPPLWRAIRYLTGEDRQVLLLVMHHLITDGWSMEILKRDLSEAYAALLADREPAWAVQRLQYADLAVWEAGAEAGERNREEIAFWRGRLLTEAAPPVLPAKAEPPDFAGESVLGRLDTQTYRAVRAIAERAGTTPFSVLLAAFALIVGRYTGRPEVQVGVPLVVRDRPESEDIVGFLTNTMVLRLDTRSADFDDLVAETRERVLEMLGHPHVPFDALVSALAPARDGRRPPFFDVWFNLLNFDRHPLALRGTRVRELRLPPAGALFDLGVYLQEDGAELEIELVYRPSAFSADRVGALLGQFIETIRRLSAGESPDAVRCAPPREPRSDFAPVPGTTLTDRFRALAVAHPERPAAAHPGGVSYGDLDRAATRLARSLTGLGAAPGRVVAIVARRTPDLLVALLAVRAAGAAFAVLDPELPGERLRARLGRFAAPLVVAVEGLPDALRDIPAVDLSGVAVSPDAGVPARAEAVAEIPETAAAVTFTSGTGGREAGAVTEEGPVTAFFTWYSERFGLGGQDRFSVLAGLSHDPLLREVLLPLWTGGTACFPPAAVYAEPEATVRWLAESRCTVVHLTPARARLLAAAARAARTAVPSVRLVTVCGAPISADDHLALRAVFPRARLAGGYGTTETPQLAGLIDLADAPALGRGGPGAELLVMAGNQEIAAVNELGEIAVRSPHLALGYVGEPERSASRFGPDPDGAPGIRLHYTGDLGRYRPDGTVDFVGRAVGALTPDGARVDLFEVEEAARAHPGVTDCAALARGSRLLLAVSAASDPALPVRLRRDLAGRLPTTMVPDEIVLVDRIPLTPNGKADPSRLPPRPGRPAAVSDEGVLAAVMALWCEVLDLPAIDPDTPFFALGGTSLGLLRVHRFLEDRFAARLTLADLFQYPTARGLAARICEGTVPDGGRAVLRRSGIGRARVARLSARYAARVAVRPS